MESEFESESVMILEEDECGGEERPPRAGLGKQKANNYIELPVISFENQLYGLITDSNTEPGSFQGQSSNFASDQRLSNGLGVHYGTANGDTLTLTQPDPDEQLKSPHNEDSGPSVLQRSLQIGIPAIVALIVIISLAVHYGTGSGTTSLPDGSRQRSEFQPSAPVHVLVAWEIEGEAHVTQGEYSHFRPEYDDLSSHVTSDLVTKFTTRVDAILKNSAMSFIYEKTKVLKIRNGSTIFHFEIDFEEYIVLNDTSYKNLKLEDRHITLNEVTETFTKAITTEKETVYQMGKFEIEKDSFKFKAINPKMVEIISGIKKPEVTTTGAIYTTDAELPETSTAISCPETQFFCPSGVVGKETYCIVTSGLCNGKDDCVDGEDEENCEKVCHGDGFLCSDGKCLDGSAKCDNIRDCDDGSDEVDCVGCSTTQFTCVKGRIVCIPKESVCNQNIDCEDGSDEANCTASCAGHEFMCHDYMKIPVVSAFNHSKPGQGCINSTLICDRVSDCSDNSDEADCDYSCPESKFKCTTGHISRWPHRGFCLEGPERCNGFTECADGSDEVNCPSEPKCKSYEFQCKDGTDVADRDHCISRFYKCDRVIDCTDGSDEVECTYECPADSDMFLCANGTRNDARGFCIPGHMQCDGEQQCGDGSDEEGCGELSCSSEHFQCENGYYGADQRRCIPEMYVCDRENDCSDGSDEKNCTYACPTGKVPCKTGLLSRWPFTGYCIHEREICDGYLDCRDKSDEENCTEVVCNDDQFKCEHGYDERLSHCIPKDYQCNKVSDCSDGSDEAGCNYTCPVSQMPCSNGTLVSKDGFCYNITERCDDKIICEDGSDEANCEVECRESEFKCREGLHVVTGSQCIGGHYRCDRVKDCTDGSDEEGCDDTCPLGLTPCATSLIKGPPHRGYCIQEHQRCNGVTDCLDNSDESSCDMICDEDEFLCRNSSSILPRGRCIMKSFRCDRDKDCVDGSDEENCDYKCPNGKFACEKGTLARFPFYGFCVNKRDVCDGYKDCADNSDEANCNGTCPEGSFKCGSSEDLTICKPMSYRCDRIKDCEDGSDEANCTYTCQEGQFKCTRGTTSRYFNIFGRQVMHFSRNYCIYDHDVCDGTKHCQDGSDEKDCEVKCKVDQFLCTNSSSIVTGSRCIPRRWQCDRDKDCMDGSDEIGCNYDCPAHQRPCKTGSLKRWPYVGYCYWSWEKCDGKSECSDGSDELDCAT